MATLKDVIGGLQIVAKYCKNGMDEDSTAAEHDILYAGVSGDKDAMSPEDIAQLDQLGWNWNDEYRCWAKWV